MSDISCPATNPPRSFAAANFSMVLGLAGLGQAWRAAAVLFGIPWLIGEAVVFLAVAIWAGFLIAYAASALRAPAAVRAEFGHPVQGATPALLGIATLLMVPAVRPYSEIAAGIVLVAGVSWHLLFAMWHSGLGWRTGRDPRSLSPTVYLPTVAGNFTSSAAFGVMGWPDIGWCFMGAGLFSWLALESLILQRLWDPAIFPAAQRSSIGIHLAPPAVAGASWLTLGAAPDHWVLMLWGYALFQLALGCRLIGWLREQPFSVAYWSYTFGVSSTAVIAVKLALAGVPVAVHVAAPILLLASLFEGYLLARTLLQGARALWAVANRLSFVHRRLSHPRVERRRAK